MKTEKPIDVFETLGEITKPVKWYDRVADEKPLAHLKDQIKPMEFKPVEHRHGGSSHLCWYCTQEIIEGKEIWIVDTKEEYILHLCEDCANDPDFESFKRTVNIKQIKNY
jgi:hypothetical protein